MKAKRILIALFSVIILIFPIAMAVLPKESFSPMENRALAQPPVLSKDSIENKSFMTGTESYFSDHLPWRDRFVAARTRMELLMGKREINGVFIGDSMLLQDIAQPDEKVTKSNCNAINEFADNYSGTVNTTVMLVPTAEEFYPNEIPLLAEPMDQTSYFQKFYKALQRVNTVDVYTPLAAASDQYIFYRTDHHWTSYGAFIGYNALAKSLGYKAYSQDMFNIEHASHNFLGTLYSKTLYGEKFKDDIDFYTPAFDDPVTDVIKYSGKQSINYSSVFVRENLEKKDKYTSFLGENAPVVKIKTNIHNGKKLLIFKDSFANTLMQFLPLHYEEIDLVDLRYLNTPITDYLDIRNFQQVLFLYNIGDFIDDSSVSKVAQY